MRLLVDVHGVAWEEAWRITQATFSYTNHTLLPEALETWPVRLMERLLPRHMQIIYLINALHLDALREKGVGDAGTLSAVSLIDEHNGRHVRMGNLAFLGSHKVNGVSALHSELVKETVFRDFHKLYPTASSTRPMASPSAAGCSRPIRRCRACSPRHWAASYSTIHRGSSNSKPMPTTPSSSSASRRPSAPTRSVSRGSFSSAWM